MAKRVSARNVKKNRLYTYEEAGDAVGVAADTVRTSWRSSGLQVMTANTPHYILGAELIRYLEDKQARRSVKMGLDQMYCFKCKMPQKPLWGMADYIPVSGTRGRLTGLCEACEGSLQRFVGRGGAAVRISMTVAAAGMNEATLQHHLALNLHLESLRDERPNIKMFLEKKVKRAEAAFDCA